MLQCSQETAMSIGDVKKSVNSLVGSVKFLKQLIPMVVTNVVYNRINYQDDYFDDHVLVDAPYKTFSRVIPKRHDLFNVHNWTRDALKALDKKYLERLYFIIRDKETDEVLENYCFTIRYEDKKKAIPTADVVAEKTTEIFKTINLLGDFVKFNPASVNYAMQVTLNKDTPKRYVTPNFVKGSPYIDPEDQDKFVTIGKISTRHVKLKLAARGELFNFVENMSEAMDVPIINNNEVDVANIIVHESATTNASPAPETAGKRKKASEVEQVDTFLIESGSDDEVFQETSVSKLKKPSPKRKKSIVTKQRQSNQQPDMEAESIERVVAGYESDGEAFQPKNVSKFKKTGDGPSSKVDDDCMAEGLNKRKRTPTFTKLQLLDQANVESSRKKGKRVTKDNKESETSCVLPPVRTDASEIKSENSDDVPETVAEKGIDVGQASINYEGLITENNDVFTISDDTESVMDNNNDIDCVCEIKSPMKTIDLIECHRCLQYEHVACIGFRSINEINKIHTCYKCHRAIGTKSLDIMDTLPTEERRQILALIRLVTLYCINTQDSAMTVLNGLPVNMRSMAIKNLIKYHVLIQQDDGILIPHFRFMEKKVLTSAYFHTNSDSMQL